MSRIRKTADWVHPYISIVGRWLGVTSGGCDWIDRFLTKALASASFLNWRNSEPIETVTVPSACVSMATPLGFGWSPLFF
jgi:hypothetical protein